MLEIAPIDSAEYYTEHLAAPSGSSRYNSHP